ncbi:hypothetical protein IJ765_00160 [Candidatus Saccharibacteria bacterium]|nr:hypothetical protein [Candidatus Saccharibacteria bacterium]
MSTPFLRFYEELKEGTRFKATMSSGVEPYSAVRRASNGVVNAEDGVLF